MTTNDALIIFVLDQSGSMGSHNGSNEQATCDGFNRFIEEQMNNEGNAYLSLVVFDTGSKVRYTAGDIKLVAPLGSKDNPYTPGGGTALYDAVADAVGDGEKWLKDNPNFNGQVICAIWTDGGENSSKGITIDALNDLMRRKKEDDNWQFAYLGSGGAAWTEGRQMAARGTATTINYGTGAAAQNAAYAAFSSSVTQTRATGQSLSSTLQAAASSIQEDPNLVQIQQRTSDEERDPNPPTPTDAA